MAEKNKGQPGDDPKGSKRNPGRSTTTTRTLDGRIAGLTGVMDTINEGDGELPGVSASMRASREDFERRIGPIQIYKALSLEEALSIEGIPEGSLIKIGSAYVSRAILCAMVKRLQERGEEVTLDGIVQMGKNTIYSSIDIIGSSNAQRLFLKDPRCPAKLRTQFILLQATILSLVTTIIHQFEGSADGYQGDEVTATFPNSKLAHMASFAIEEALEGPLAELRGLIEEFNNKHANGGKKYDVQGGLRITHVGGEGLTLMTNPDVCGSIIMGKPIKTSKEYEKNVKDDEGKMLKNDPKALDTTKVFSNNLSTTLKKDRAEFEKLGKQFPKPVLRVPKGHDRKEIATAITEGTKLPRNEEASKYPNSTIGVPFCVYLPEIDDTMDKREYHRLISLIVRTMQEYQCEDVKAVIEGKGIFTTFENGDTELLAARAMQAVKKVIQDFNQTSSRPFNPVCGIGKKGRVVRFRAGDQARHEITRIGNEINELFRGMGVAIGMYADGEPRPISISLTARNKIEEYYVVGETKHHPARNMPDGIYVTELSEMKGKRRAKTIRKNEDKVVVIGEGLQDAMSELDALLNLKTDEKSAEDRRSKVRVIRMKASPPIDELVAKKTLERKDTSAVCIVRPEGQDAFDEYQTLGQIIAEMAEKEFDGDSKVFKAAEKVYAAMRAGKEAAIKDALVKFLTTISEKEQGVLSICIVESESMDASSRITLESAVKKLPSGKVRLIVMGRDIEDPDVDKEGRSATVSKEEAVDIIKYILEMKAGRVEEGGLISEDDLELIATSLPRIGGTERIQSAYINTAIGELIAEGHLHADVDPAWKVEDSISNIEYQDSTILARKLNRLNDRMDGIMLLAYAIASANRPVKPEELPRVRVKQAESTEGDVEEWRDLTPSEIEIYTAKLAAQGIIIKIDISEKSKATQTDDTKDEGNFNVGKEGYIIDPLYKNAIEACLVGWKEGRAEVHDTVLYKLNQNTDDLRPKKAKELRSICLMHHSKYFEYYEGLHVNKRTLELLTSYMEILRLDVQEDLERNNRVKVASKLKEIFALKEVLEKKVYDGGEAGFRKAKKQYLELVSIYSGAAQRSRTSKEALLKEAGANSNLMAFAERLAAEEGSSEAGAEISIMAGLISIRSCLTEMQDLADIIKSQKRKKATQEAIEKGSIDVITRILERANELTTRYIVRNLEVKNSPKTQLRIANALQLAAITSLLAAEALAKLRTITVSGFDHNSCLQEAEKKLTKASEFAKGINEISLSEQQGKALKTIENSLAYTAKVTRVNIYAAAAGLELEDTIEWHENGANTRKGNLKIEKMLEESIAEIVGRVLEQQGLPVLSMGSPLEHNILFERMSIRVDKFLDDKAEKAKAEKVWEKPKPVLSALVDYSENARKLARAYGILEGKALSVSRKQAYENILIKARKAAELARKLNDYPNEQGELLYDFIPVYNMIEISIELALLRNDSATNQAEFDTAIDELIKIKIAKGPICDDIPLQREIEKLYEWAHMAGLTVPPEYMPLEEDIQLEAPGAGEAQEIDVLGTEE